MFVSRSSIDRVSENSAGLATKWSTSCSISKNRVLHSVNVVICAGVSPAPAPPKGLPCALDPRPHPRLLAESGNRAESGLKGPLRDSRHSNAQQRYCGTNATRRNLPSCIDFGDGKPRQQICPSGSQEEARPTGGELAVAKTALK